MGLERFTKDRLQVSQYGKIVTICNAEAITDANPHTYVLTTLSGLSEEEIRTYNNFKISFYNTHNQAATVSFLMYNMASGTSNTAYTEASNLPATTGALHLISENVGTGGASVFKTIAALGNVVHANMAVTVTFGVAPASGALTIKVEMH